MSKTPRRTFLQQAALAAGAASGQTGPAKPKPDAAPPISPTRASSPAVISR